MHCFDKINKNAKKKYNHIIHDTKFTKGLKGSDFEVE